MAGMFDRRHDMRSDRRCIARAADMLNRNVATWVNIDQLLADSADASCAAHIVEGERRRTHAVSSIE
ncbi:hypothetical protein AU184_25780 [Mycolicibacterium novocastrense]|nr:hypothetical protein AU183_14295 [Mycolicibacterium novocastrense]KUH66486.1 hypothetical protein AU184_25780 [Mycolicibacterium novocastrense]KUH67267.1 hypothetical protein AU072_24005 [Mycolicibacterium novocastrense]OBF88380.1 hypothetical protein A5790_24170 [Mycobacterium sp. 852002-51152_SCH6134967]